MTMKIESYAFGRAVAGLLGLALPGVAVGSDFSGFITAFVGIPLELLIVLSIGSISSRYIKNIGRSGVASVFLVCLVGMLAIIAWLGIFFEEFQWLSLISAGTVTIAFMSAILAFAKRGRFFAAIGCWVLFFLQAVVSVFLLVDVGRTIHSSGDSGFLILALPIVLLLVFSAYMSAVVSKVFTS